ncbi:MAG: lamin tail domain-containing protein [candidate division WOR-3 bacterium]|nr:lamin tail domain-containing protein [candidate division WOR-3 bacterium]
MQFYRIFCWFCGISFWGNLLNAQNILSNKKFSSRVVINEVMANPKGTNTSALSAEDRNEFIELYNITADTVDLSGWRIYDFQSYDNIIQWSDTTLLIRYPNVVINSTLLPPYSFAIILDPEYTASNPVGGYIQPYQLPDSLLVLTIGNTAFGDNGLATTDPILLFSPTGDSSSYGTPFNPNDSFPRRDYGSTNDGLSWERISPWAEDSIINWIRSLDTTGSTPGRDNSIFSYYDLAVSGFEHSPVIITENQNVTMFIKVTNYSYQFVGPCTLNVINDIDRDGFEDSGERLYICYDLSILPQSETTLSFVWQLVPKGEHLLEAIVVFARDQKPNNNRISRIIRVTSPTGNYSLTNKIFSPDGDGVDDTLFVQYNFPETKGTLKVSIYNLNAHLIKTYEYKKLTTQNGVITWDGKTENGNLAPIGIYIVLLEYKSKNYSITEKHSTVLAKKIK